MMLELGEKKGLKNIYLCVDYRKLHKKHVIYEDLWRESQDLHDNVYKIRIYKSAKMYNLKLFCL